MRVGYESLNTADGIRPDVLAREVEQRGFDSVWMPEHSHIPVSRDTPYIDDQELPDGYLHMMDPFTSLAAAAVATSRITLATGVALPLEHDLLTLGCQTATLDVLCEGRFLFGVGVGWNREEFEDHRPDVPFSQRYSALSERIAALRTIWSEDQPAFEGRWDRFPAAWVFPKPVRRSIPVAFGNAGPIGMRLAARHADVWCPLDSVLLDEAGQMDAVGAIGRFRALVEEEGRDPMSVGISLYAWGEPSRALFERYAELGVERLVFGAPTLHRHGADETLRRLDEVYKLVDGIVEFL
ncbi:MAG: TIGR03619 family F420-dependent LLM class oxidoreductase [Acidimicrobiia bacterium]